MNTQISKYFSNVDGIKIKHIDMNELNTIEIIKIVLRNWKRIGLVTLIGIIVGVIVASPLVKKPLFKSQAILYPYNISHFSEESPSETMDEFLDSPEMMFKMDEKFKLGKHYKLDSTSTNYKDLLTQIYRENFSFSLTSNRSVELEVFDTDPKLAQKYCYGIIECLDEMFIEKLTQKTKDEIKLWTIQKEFAEKRMDSIKTILKDMSNKYGLLNFYTQTKEASKVQYKLIAQGKSTQSNPEFNQLIVGLREKGFEFYALDNEYGGLLALRSEAISVLVKLDRDLKKKFTYSMIVSAPDLPLKKSKPIRWVIVLSFAVSAFVFSLFLLFLEENKIWQKLKS
jgi:LPS O-antigen subunit length determinant protein (WzzB/FepE family)